MQHTAMVVFSYYYKDPRVRRAAEALAEAGFQVDIFCLREQGRERHSETRGVRVIGLPVRHMRSSPVRYILQYAMFWVLAFGALTLRHIMRRYRLVHIHNMPDFLVFTALTPRLFGAKVILDLHDPTPEVFMTMYSLERSHPFIRLLHRVEQASIAFADQVFTPNLAFRDLFIQRGCPPQKIQIVMNTPQPSIFGAPRPPSLPGAEPLRIMYHGTIVRRHGLDSALEALRIMRGRGIDARFDVYGSGNYLDEFLERTRELGLDNAVRYRGMVPLDRVPAAIARSDIGVIPNLKTPFTELNLPTRILEYIVMGKPVVAPSTRGILDYFDRDSLFLFEPGNPLELAERIIEAGQNPTRVRKMIERGQEIYKRFAWDSQKRRMLAVVGRLLDTGRTWPAFTGAKLGMFR